MKDIDKSVDHYKMRKELADGFRDEMRGHNERRVTMQGNIQQLERDKAELEVKLNRLQDQYREAEKIKNEISTKELKLAELKRNREDLEAEITRVLTCSAVELKNEIEKFQITKVIWLS
jgi:chromosome segregation ATPase